MPSTTPLTTGLSGVVVVVLVDFLSQHRAWGWMRMVQGASPLKNLSGLKFSKVMGSGHDGGFGLRPSATHQGLLCLFDQLPQAQAFIDGEVVQSYRQRAREHWVGLMAINSSRGEWDGHAWASDVRTHTPTVAPTVPPAVPPTTPTPSTAPASTEPLLTAPLATLTRASIRPASAMAFWRYAPAAQDSLQHASGCQLAIGLGEAPLLRQCTFSVWDSEQDMHQYARQGAHQQAIQAAYKHTFFSESMFVRMRLLHSQGVWRGKTHSLNPAHPPEARHV